MAQYEKLEDKRIKLTVTIPAEDFQQAIEQAYIKEHGRFAVPGFRKGKAPPPHHRKDLRRRRVLRKRF